MYEVRTIETTNPLNTESRHPWFRYVINNELNTITGYRSGRKEEVRRFARDCAAYLNWKYPPINTRKLNSVQINVSYISQLTCGLHRE